jgi:hypothetical protein
MTGDNTGINGPLVIIRLEGRFLERWLAPAADAVTLAHGRALSGVAIATVLEEGVK